jgi:hypothetical protein
LIPHLNFKKVLELVKPVKFENAAFTPEKSIDENEKTNMWNTQYTFSSAGGGDND